jgi:DNA-binding transcriptional LysR family regulator
LRLTQLDIAGAASGRRNTRDEAHAQLVFDDALAMLEAASAGAGVAWSTETAARPYLAQGRLARASEDVRDGLRYAADLSEAGQLKPLATACHAWLIEHAGEH